MKKYFLLAIDYGFWGVSISVAKNLSSLRSTRLCPLLFPAFCFPKEYIRLCRETSNSVRHNSKPGFVFHCPIIYYPAKTVQRKKLRKRS